MRFMQCVQAHQTNSLAEAQEAGLDIGGERLDLCSDYLVQDFDLP